MNDIQLFSENELTPIETEERAFHEGVVDDVKGGIEKLASIGDASLKVLRDKRLYRTTHKTFEDYCQERFGFTRRSIDRMVGFAVLLDDLRPRGLKLPATEYQARPLTTLSDPELQAQAWTQAQADSGKEQPSNREVAEAVAKIKAELDAATQRCEEFRQESNERRKTIRDLETQMHLLKAQPKPEKVIVAPDDYETAKARLVMLETELTTIKKEQVKLVNDQVNAKLRERQTELDEIEQRKTIMEEKVERMKTYMASLESDIKRAEIHHKVIEEQRLHLISLAAFISDMDPINDQDTIRHWMALADMYMEASNSVRLVFGEKSNDLKG